MYVCALIGMPLAADTLSQPISKCSCVCVCVCARGCVCVCVCAFLGMPLAADTLTQPISNCSCMCVGVHVCVFLDCGKLALLGHLTVALICGLQNHWDWPNGFQRTLVPVYY